MRGFAEVFRFSLRQQLAVKTVKRLTVWVSLLLFFVPLLGMTFIELGRDTAEEPGAEVGEEAPDDYSAAGVSAVYYAAETRDGFLWNSLGETGLPGFPGIPLIRCGTAEEAAGKAAADDRSLILLIREEEGCYVSAGLLPEGSRLSLPKAEFLADSFAGGWQVLYLLENGLSEEQILSVLRPVEFLTDSAEAPGTETEPEPEDGEAGDGDGEEFSGVREILSMILPYLNIMVVYFLVLYYGQSTANCVILEKNSKLMDSFLVAVKPKAMIFGKVLATWTAAILQFLCWVLSLAAGFGLGSFLVRQINPASPMELLQIFGMLRSMTRLFALPEIVLAVLLVLGGFFVYCTMAAIAGSFASKPEELSSTIGLFTLTLVISMFVTLEAGFINRSPDLGACWYDFIPFTASLITPSKVLLGYVDLGGGLLALLSMLVLSAVFIRLAGKVYTMMSLYRGKVPKLPEIFRMLRS